MKRLSILFICCLCAFCGAQAQSLKGSWYNGWLCYDASVMDNVNRDILMSAMAEGEEHEFVLIPLADKPGNYLVSEGPNDYAMDQEGTWVKHVQQNGWDVLCFYDDDNNQVGVMEKTTQQDAERLNVAGFINQIMGDYTLEKSGTKVKIQWEQMDINGVTVPYKVVTFNGQITTCIELEKNNTRLAGGTYEVRPTLKGLNICPVAFPDGGGWFKRLGDEKGQNLTESNPGLGRFNFASTILLKKDALRNYDSKMLRYMRNEILARHGYRFQSKDLNDYFSNQPWYHSVEDNEEVHPTFIEELNIATIKYAELEANEAETVTREDREVMEAERKLRNQ